METIRRNLIISLRQFRRQPGLSAAILLTLGLAIGANTAIFSFVNALLIRPFPFRDPDQLVKIEAMRGGQPGKLSIREIRDIQEQATMLEAIAAHTNSAGGYNFSGEGPKNGERRFRRATCSQCSARPLRSGAPGLRRSTGRAIRISC